METDNIIDKLNNYKKILSAMTEQYLCIFAFDIQDGSVFDVKSDMSYKMPENKLILQQMLYSKIEKFAILENVPKMKKFTNLSDLEERLENKKIVSKMFQGRDHSWCNSKFIRLSDESPLRYVLCIIEKVDDQILFFKDEQKGIKENKKLRSMMDAFLEEYNTVCSVNLETKKVEFSQLSERLVDSYHAATRMGNAEELAAMYVNMAIHKDDQERLSQILTKKYIEENIEVGNSSTFTYRNELDKNFEMRIYRNNPDSIFLGFKDKSIEIESMNNKIYTDSLTGAKNRKYYDEQVVTEKCEAIVICDIDYFKSFNDTYGHQFGDCVISIVADTLKKCLDSLDDVIRYGGDEFVIIFKNITKENLQLILEKMRTSIENIEFNEETEIHLSMSFGAVYGNGIADELLLKADEALYESKKNRNTFTIKNIENGKSYMKTLKNNI